MYLQKTNELRLRHVFCIERMNKSHLQGNGLTPKRSDNSFNSLTPKEVEHLRNLNNFIHLRSEEKNIYLDDGVSPDSDGACRKRHAAVEP